MAGVFKEIATLCAVFDKTTGRELPAAAIPDQLVEILPRPPAATEDWQLVRLYDDNRQNFQEVFVREKFLKIIDEPFVKADFAAQCLVAANAFGANLEALLAVAEYLTGCQNVPQRASSACGPFLLLEQVWEKAALSVADIGIVSSDRLMPYMQPFVAAANMATTMAKFQQSALSRPATLAELTFVHMFGLRSADLLIAQSSHPGLDPSIETVIDDYCAGDLGGKVQKSVLIGEIGGDKPRLIGTPAARPTASQVISALDADLVAPLTSTQAFLSSTPGLIDPPPQIVPVLNVPTDVAPVPNDDPPPFADISTPLGETFWPVITADAQAMVISYTNTAGKVVGRSGRRFFADRRDGARHHVGMDAFCRENDVVVAVAPGRVVNFFKFYTTNTGEDSFALFVEHSGVVVNYGEVRKNARQEFGWNEGDSVSAGQRIARVSSTNMIHFETYQPGTTQNSRWLRGDPRPPQLLNPTMLLLRIASLGRRIDTNGTTSASTGSAQLGSRSGQLVDEADLLTLARTIYGEARNQIPKGREAVAHVIQNRVRRNVKDFGGNSIVSVCRHDRQFSCWNIGDPNRSIIMGIRPGANAIFDECLGTAEKVIRGELSDNTDGATHYYAKSIRAPNWTAPPARFTVEIGAHRFFTNVP
jgi:murein DD-endopeptidase MepM/ murein hydrolase activator NlpD